MDTLDTLLMSEMLRALGVAHLPGFELVRSSDDSGYEAHVRLRTCDWVPDGLALAGREHLARSLLALPDYPELVQVVQAPGEVCGVAALPALAAWLSQVAGDVQARADDVRDEVAALQGEFGRAAAQPWHITDFDPYAQTISLGARRLAISTHRRTGGLEDLSTLFLRPFLQDGSGKHTGRLVATVETVDRGATTIHVATG